MSANDMSPCAMARRDEREKVLDEVISKLWEQTFVPFGSSPEYHIIAWDRIKEIIKELRGEQR
jgi:hypothetical protein